MVPDLPANELRIAFLGDIVGSPGRRAAGYAAKKLREERGVGLLIANAENARNGSGLSPDNLGELTRAGFDMLTLGDHCFRDRAILTRLEDPDQPVLRPANLSLSAPGKRVLRALVPGGPPVYVLTVLGRLFMPVPADNPFEAIDRELGSITDERAVAVVEIHAEATSEKQAIAHHCARRWTDRDAPVRVVGVVGSHTHTPTSDARIIEHSLAAITDLGMTGPHASVIGRDIGATVDAMSRNAPVPLEVASGNLRAQGVLIRVDTEHRRAVGVEQVDIGVVD